ncbi:MAG: transcription termination/antitermination protein NusA [Clostridia bacterium]|nr:transcription termination/antitermination protein NusA [Clostridia bacterium]
MNEELYKALADLEKEKGISADYMIERLRQAMTAAYNREYQTADAVVEFDVDKQAKTIEMYVLKTVADPVEVPALELSRDEAYAAGASAAEPGDTVRVELDTRKFGRIAAQTAKQVIIQGIRESERGAAYQEYSSKEHEMLTAVVSRVDMRSGNVFLELKGARGEDQTLVLPPSEQIRGEDLREGDYVKVFLIGVHKGPKGVQIQISRTHPGLVRRLFETEVPEIFDGVVEIMSVSREAGSRTKIAVRSNDANVDPIGACVGPKGARVGAVVKELRGEKIDIVKYSDDPCEYASAALAPAEVVDAFEIPEEKCCRIVVPDDQLSLAIGREGQNARLAARLTGLKIDIKPRSQA